MEGIVLKKKLSLIFQIAAVFIGTIVGAGLASGQEIKQFFTSYGCKSFIGIVFCCFIYMFIGNIVINLSIKYKLNSYNELITLVSPGFLGRVTDLITGFFLVSGAGIILAGSGALLHQYFGVSKWVGICLMTLISLFTLLKNTKGLIEINSFIVPSLTAIIITIFILYIIFNKDVVTTTYIKNIPFYKNNWFISCLLYGGFNILCCTGVLVPLSNEIKKKNSLLIGVAVGAIGLTILSVIINLLLLLNTPYIYQYEIPLLYIANRFGKPLQLLLLCVIWCEMFSTEVSDIYSVAKTLEHAVKLPYKTSVFLILAVALPISQIGFVRLITILYPAFGVVSFIFMIQCIIFYYRKKI